MTRKLEKFLRKSDQLGPGDEARQLRRPIAFSLAWAGSAAVAVTPGARSCSFAKRSQTSAISKRDFRLLLPVGRLFAIL
jgi:hypothetical protein